MNDKRERTSSKLVQRQEDLSRRSIAPGKRTLTQGLSARPAGPRPPVQQKPSPAAEAEHRAQAELTEQWFNTALRPDLNPRPVQRKSTADEQDRASPLPAGGSGQAMPEDVQAKMEHSFGTDFSAVRIHEGPSATAMGALAYTQGTDIHFAPGQYQPGSRNGQELLGHELTHVVQQSQGRVQPTVQAKGVGINDDAGLEREADAMGAKAARGERVDGATALVAHPSGSQPLQKMKIRGTDKAAELSSATRNKHVVAAGDQQAAAEAAYLHSTFVTSAADITSAVDANAQDFLEAAGTKSPRFDFDANVTISQWNKTEGPGKNKPVTRTIENTSAPCEIGVVKTGDDRLQVTHFKMV